MEVTESTVLITHSLFEDNEAEVDGGGLYFSVSNNFTRNSVYLYNNSFVGNRVFLSTGGAISWHSFIRAFNNFLLLEDCRFISNSGSAGGAMSISLYETSLDSFLQPNEVEFRHCLFQENTATLEGTAVAIFALVHVEEFGYPVIFTNW